MSVGDNDFYYRRKPNVEIVRLQNVSIEGRGAAITYEDQMFARDGTIPDEGTADGMRWHRTVLKAKNARTVLRLIAELLKEGVLLRLGDKRLSMEHVLKELAARGRKPKPAKNGGGGPANGGGQGNLTLIDGGRSPPRPVDSAADRLGANWQSEIETPTYVRLAVKPRRKPQRNQWAAFPLKAIATHELLLSPSLVAARARGDPAAARA